MVYNILMFMLAVQNHQPLKIIDQKFLVPGHTRLGRDGQGPVFVSPTIEDVIEKF